MENQKKTSNREPESPETPKDIVKNIFDKPKKGSRPVSSIFTHYKGSPRIISSSKGRLDIPHHIKPLPAAIDIGTTSVKIMRLGENQKREFEVICLDSEPCGGQGDFSASVKKALKALAERNKLGAICVSNIPSKDVEIYNMLFPPMSEEELASAIQYKIAQLKPFGMTRENLIIRWKSWEIAKGMQATSQRRIIAAAAPRDVVTKRILMLKNSGFHPVDLEAPQFSLINLKVFAKELDHKDEVMLWVHIGAKESFLAIEKNRSILFAKKLGLTSDEITRSIAKQSGITDEEAEKLKKDVGFSLWSETKELSPEGPKNKSESVYYALVSILENLVVDIEHSFKYFSYQVAQSQIASFNRVILSGGGANLKSLDKFLKVRLGVAVGHFNTFNTFKVPEAVKNERVGLIDEPATFALSSALASGQRLEKSRRLNFMPEEAKGLFKTVRDVLRYAPVKIAIVLIVIAAFLSTDQISKAGRHKARMDSMTEEFKKAKFSISEMETRAIELAKEEGELILKKKLLKAQLSLIKKGYRGPTEFSEVLSAVATHLPEEIWINELKYEEGKLIISGSTIDLILVTNLVEDIRDAKEFVGADFSYTQKEPEIEIYSFEITGYVTLASDNETTEQL